MSQAEDLLNALSGDEVETYSANSEAEEHFVIGEDRRINVPDALRRLAVQHDHNVETVTFDCPRYSDELDMSRMAVYINYRLPDGTLDSYPAHVTSADETTMYFTWTISRNVTPQKGNIAFLVCVKKTDVEGNEVNHWNSELCTDCYISEGLEAVETAIKMYPDIITQLLLRMDSVEQVRHIAEEAAATATEASATVEAAKSEVLEAREFVANSADNIRNNYAPALRNTAYGELVRVDDVSPIEHTVKTVLRSKNLIPCPYDEADQTKTGVTFTTLSDGGLKVVGTPTANTSFNLAMQYKKRLLVEKGKTYTISVVSTLTGARGHVFVQAWANGKSFYSESLRQGSLTFSPSEDGSVQIGVVLLKDQVFDETMYIQLEVGDIATDYMPYVDPTLTTLHSAGKNLLVYPYADKSISVRGITITMNDDGTLTLAGTADNTQNYYFHRNETMTLAPGIYTVSVGNEVECDVEIRVWLYKTSTAKQVAHLSFPKLTSITFEVTETISFDVYIMVMGGSTIGGKLKLQIEPGNKATSYESYKGTSYTPSSDGTVEDVVSVSPTMVMYTGIDGVIPHIEYNADTKKYIDNKLESSISAVLEAIMNDSY